jgi:hypothetical protein
MAPKQTNQIKQQQIHQIQFTIQTLEGRTFPVSIPVTEAEKVHQEPSDPYNNYGLDYLKDAICSSTGNDSVSQQLICEEELTISTPLLPLADSVITLIVKPSFTIETQYEYKACQSGRYAGHPLLWEPKLSYISNIVCYFYNSNPKPRISNLRVIGQRRDFFKIAIADLKSANAVLRTGHSLPKPYQITTDTPTYVWLRFVKDYMKIVLNE